MSKEHDLRQAALDIRDRAYAPYSKFQVGAVLRTPDGRTYVGCNVENIAFPEGTCAEAGAIAAMVADGVQKISEVYVIADAPHPVPPCGGCRQKLAEFADGDVRVTMATVDGQEWTQTVSDLLPGAFDASHFTQDDT